MRLLLAIFALGLAAGLPAQEIRKPKAEFPESGLVTYRLRIRSIPTLRAKVNGIELTLGVDTGCQGVGVLTPAAAARAGISPDFTIPTLGNSGRDESSFGYVHTLEAGEAVWRDFHIALLPLEGMELDGLIGADLLFAQPFYLDLANKVMILGRTPDTSAAHEVPCYSRGGHCGVNLEVEGQKVPMVIDSGASKSYLSSLKFKGKTTFRGYLPVATVRGVSLTRIEVCQARSLRIGGVPLHGVELVRNQEHNLLGGDFLRAHPIAVDMASRRLWLFEAQGADGLAKEKAPADVPPGPSLKTTK